MGLGGKAMRRVLASGLGLVALGLLGAAYYFLATYEPPAIDPDWQVEGVDSVPEGAVSVRYTGTSTLLFSDGETRWMIDGWFTRVGPLALAMGEIEPDLAAIDYGLLMNEVDRLSVVIPVHSHFDHAMDAPEVARRTGAILLGSESTANIARGWKLPEAQIRIAQNREATQFGKFTITLIETRHFQFPDPEVAERALASPRIEAPLIPPVKAFDYRLGTPYAVHVAHPAGSWLIQGSAGFVEGGLDGYPADIVFLGTGGLGTQTAEYRESYWRETVEVSGATRIIPIHWDSLTGPIQGPFTGPVRAASFLGGGSDQTLAFLGGKARANPGLRFEVLPRYAPVVLFEATPR
jgi:L-ascorbate metabolism protein UlaG (beta-lactamase superfamily)